MRFPKRYQPSLFDQVQELKTLGIVFDMAAGKKLGEVGLDLSLETAEKKEKGWTKLCWQLFLWWLRRNIKRGSEFMIEDFRMHVKKMGLLDDPPSNRSFGVIPKYGQGKYFQFVRKDKTKSKIGHGANASVWMKL
jgi:hypothetical protein